MIETVVLL